MSMTLDACNVRTTQYVKQSIKYQHGSLSEFLGFKRYDSFPNNLLINSSSKVPVAIYRGFNLMASLSRNVRRRYWKCFTFFVKETFVVPPQSFADYTTQLSNCKAMKRTFIFNRCFQ